MNIPNTSPPQLTNAINIPTIQRNTAEFSSVFSIQNIIIAFLLMIIILPILGISTDALGTIIQRIILLISSIVSWVVSSIAFLTGNVLNTTTDVISTTAKTGIDITDDTLNSVGDLLIKASKNDNSFDKNLNKGTNATNNTAEPSNSENPIQKSTASNKTSWCLVGEYQGKRGCVEVSDSNKCMSGQLFPSQSVCINPNITSYKN